MVKCHGSFLFTVVTMLRPPDNPDPRTERMAGSGSKVTRSPGLPGRTGSAKGLAKETQIGISKC